MKKIEIYKKNYYLFFVKAKSLLNKKKYYHKSAPLYRTVNIINKIYDDGHVVKIVVARFMGGYDDKVEYAISKGYSFTNS
jgi:hypothetical protein